MKSKPKKETQNAAQSRGGYGCTKEVASNSGVRGQPREGSAGVDGEEWSSLYPCDKAGIWRGKLAPLAMELRVRRPNGREGMYRNVTMLLVVLRRSQIDSRHRGVAHVERADDIVVAVRRVPFCRSGTVHRDRKERRYGRGVLAVVGHVAVGPGKRVICWRVSV